MKKNSNIVKSAKVTNVISACIMVLSGALLLFLPDMERITAQRILLSVLFALIGSAKLLGYFCNDLYRLAFQFDFAIGIFCWIFALLIFLTPEHFFSTMPTLLSVYGVLDALLKLQISMDARRFGMSGWVGMLCSSLFLFAVSALTIGSIYWDWLPKTRAVGIALALDGLQNGWITAYTVRVRARKKHLTEHFGLDEEQDETSD